MKYFCLTVLHLIFFFLRESINTNKPAGYAEDGRVVEKGRELLGVEGGGGDEKLEIASEADDVLHQTEQYVRVKGALVCLVCVNKNQSVLSTRSTSNCDEHSGYVIRVH